MHPVPSPPEPSHPTDFSPCLDSRRLPIFQLKRLDEPLPEVLLPVELEDLLEGLSDPSQPIPWPQSSDVVNNSEVMVQVQLPLFGVRQNSRYLGWNIVQFAT